MLNLVGPRDFSGAYMLNNLEKMLSIPGIYVHLYGKNESKPDRKLGHITVIADTKEELFEKVELAKTLSIHKATR
jgi:5-(carboxyamino)imidazole ribonucleotide synthase